MRSTSDTVLISGISFQPSPVECFVAELKTLAKTCNFFDCLRDSLIHDCIVLGIKDEQTTKKLLRILFGLLSGARYFKSI